VGSVSFELLKQIVTDVERHLLIITGVEIQVDANIRCADRLSQSISI
jgi:hypothetical protein